MVFTLGKVIVCRILKWVSLVMIIAINNNGIIRNRLFKNDIILQKKRCTAPPYILIPATYHR